jgi:hypothetical protein
VFPFARFPGVDTVLGPEMRSTGEVMGLSSSFEVAFAKSQLGSGTRVPTAARSSSRCATPTRSEALSDSRSMRRAALLHKVPYYTTLAGAVAAAKGIEAYASGHLEVFPLQAYFAQT